MPPTIHSKMELEKRSGSSGYHAGGSRPSGSSRGTSSIGAGERRPELICRVKYTNSLPDIPFDPKFIQYPFDPQRFVAYKETTLEKSFKWDLHTEHDLGVGIELVDPEAYTVAANNLHPDDERLLEEEAPGAAVAESKRSRLHQTPASWLRKTEYMSAEYNRASASAHSSDKSEARIGYRIRKQMDNSQMYKDRETQIETIRQTFEVAKQSITSHYSKPGVVPVEVLPVFPDFQMWGLPCAQVIFDSDPSPSSSNNKQQQASVATSEHGMKEAVIRGMMDDSGEQFVAYFLPSQENLEQRNKDAEQGITYEPDKEYEYSLAKEYNWTVKHKGSRGYEQSYFFIVRPDGVYYNELETRVRLSRRKLDQGKKSAMTTTKLMLKHRPFDQQELAVQEARLSNLEPAVEGEDEDDDEEDEEDEKKEDGAEGKEDGGNKDKGDSDDERKDSDDERKDSDDDEKDSDEKASSDEAKSDSDDDKDNASKDKRAESVDKDDEEGKEREASDGSSDEDEKVNKKRPDKDAEEIFGSSSSDSD